MREKVSLVLIYIISLLLVLALISVAIPTLLYAPLFLTGFLNFLVRIFITPIFNVLTPIGGILALGILIAAVLMFIIKRENSRAAACYLPGVGAVCAIMEYTRIEKDEHVKFHTNQGLILFAITSIILIIGLVLLNMGGTVTVIGYYVLSLLFIFGAILLAYLMYLAYTGKKIEILPVSKEKESSTT